MHWAGTPRSLTRAGRQSVTPTPANGHVATITNRRGARLSYRYDALGRLLAEHDPTAGDSSNFAYSIQKNNVTTARWNALERDTLYSDSTGWRDSVKTYIPATGKTYTQHYKPTQRFQLDSAWETGSTLNFSRLRHFGYHGTLRRDFSTRLP